MRQYHVAVVGATGAVGQAMGAILAERRFPVATLTACASARSAGKKISFAGQTLTVRDLATFDFTGIDIALFSAGGSISAEHAPRAARSGAVVIDNTSQFRYDHDIPLVVPEVNAHAVVGFRSRNIIANPNCSTIQMVVALKPLHNAAIITRVNVATYQATGGAGQKGMDELRHQARAVLDGEPSLPQVFQLPIAFNAIPHIDSFQPNGYTREEMKMVWETQKILDPLIQVNATCVRIGAFVGHGEAVHIETKYKLAADEARALLEKAPGVVVVDERSDGGYPTHVTHAAGHDPVYVGRIREDISHPHGLDMWIVADNVRKGAALNAVQIAELLIREKYL